MAGKALVGISKQAPPDWHPPMQSPWSYGQMMLDENPGFKNSPAFKNGFEVHDAPQHRQKTPYGQERYSEWYEPGEKGGTKHDMLPNPGNPKRAVDEIYRPDVLSNPDMKKELILGEMLHGAAQDPQYAQFRNQFAQSFTPQEQQRQLHGMTDKQSDFYAYPGETQAQMMNRSGTDAYLRGSFMPHLDDPRWAQSYSPAQQAIVQQMQQYLKTGQHP